jgi:hypothetical protein
MFFSFRIYSVIQTYAADNITESCDAYRMTNREEISQLYLFLLHMLAESSSPGTHMKCCLREIKTALSLE